MLERVFILFTWITYFVVYMYSYILCRSFEHLLTLHMEDCTIAFEKDRNNFAFQLDIFGSHSVVDFQ